MTMIQRDCVKRKSQRRRKKEEAVRAASSFGRRPMIRPCINATTTTKNNNIIIIKKILLLKFNQMFQRLRDIYLYKFCAFLKNKNKIAKTNESQCLECHQNASSGVVFFKSAIKSYQNWRVLRIFESSRKRVTLSHENEEYCSICFNVFVRTV